MTTSPPAPTPVRGYAALYLGGMGSRQKNFYNDLAIRMGYAKQAKRVQDLYLDKQYREAMAAVPLDFVDRTRCSARRSGSPTSSRRTPRPASPR